MAWLLGFWYWLIGKKKCQKCGVYDTQQLEKVFQERQQIVETDDTLSYKEHVEQGRPQARFNYDVYRIQSKCNVCKHVFADIDISRRKA